MLTTKVGGFGLNLTGASRALILDPDWNPANDNQAIDRISRIGQVRDVIVYRLVSVGTIEEKIYRRQVFKRGINLQTIEGGEKEQFEKYFGDSDLFELLEFNGGEQCDTLDMLIERDGFKIESTPTNDRHVKYLRNLKVVKGLSANTHLYTRKEEENEEDEELFLMSVQKEEDSHST